jgi:hypothetical protein
MHMLTAYAEPLEISENARRPFIKPRTTYLLHFGTALKSAAHAGFKSGKYMIAVSDVSFN